MRWSKVTENPYENYIIWLKICYVTYYLSIVYYRMIDFPWDYCTMFKSDIQKFNQKSRETCSKTFLNKKLFQLVTFSSPCILYYYGVHPFLLSNGAYLYHLKIVTWHPWLFLMAHSRKTLSLFHWKTNMFGIRKNLYQVTLRFFHNEAVFSSIWPSPHIYKNRKSKNWYEIEMSYGIKWRKMVYFEIILFAL